MKTSCLSIVLLVFSLLGIASAAAGDSSPAGLPPFSLANLAELDGSLGAPSSGAARWRQALHEARAASGPESVLPAGETVRREAAELARSGVVPIAVLDARVPASDAAEKGLRVFAASALREYTYRGEEVRFLLDPGMYLIHESMPARIEIDFGDGLGYRGVRVGEPAIVRYGAEGRRTIRLAAYDAEGNASLASFPFDVRALRIPFPNDTLAVTATEPYLGQYGTGSAYVYLGEGHSAVVNPVVVIEGFDLDNTMDWDELYALLNQQNLVETLRAEGYDAVVLNFTDATDYMQKNAYVVEALLEQVAGAIDPAQDILLIGASMGGVLGRYALAWMESQAIDPRVRTFLSFDGPQNGANIPLGVQYWLDFFSDLSTDAAYLLGRLDTPAARQLLVYHHTTPPGATGAPDPLRTAFEADLAALGGWSSGPRLVAIANGSGAGANQGFAAGAQIIRYEYDGLLVDITGNVWAVPDGGSAMILDGRIRIWPLSPDVMQVTVSGTEPYDNAPGGWRSSMAQMDSTAAPYGDIIALHPNHCFIPTVSAVALDTGDLFYPIAGDPNVLAHTPFDTIYVPAENQEHVLITPESAAWFLHEVRMHLTDVVPAGGAPLRLALHGARPNPFNPATVIRYDLPEACAATLEIFDVSGQAVRVLKEGAREGAGSHEVLWNGEDAGGRPVPSGVYFCRLRAAGRSESERLVLIR